MGCTEFKDGAIIKGKDLRGCTLCKILSEHMEMREFQYKSGMKVDVRQFARKGSCKAGLHFFVVQDAGKFLDYGTRLAVVNVPDDEDVYVNGGKFCTHRLEIMDLMPLSSAATWKYLAANGVDITADAGRTVVEAAAEGYLDVVKYLHENGVDISIYNNYAVRWAATEGHLAVVKYLYENGADITACDNEAVINAAENGHLNVVKYLHANGADIMAHNNAAVRWAKAKGHVDVVKFLCENGADITAKDDTDSYLDW